MKAEPTRICPRCEGRGKLPATGVGPLMRQIRESAGISLRSMARMLKISAPYLSDLELDRRGWNGQLINRFKLIVKQKGRTRDR